MKTHSTCHTFNDILFLVQPHTHDTPPPFCHDMWLYFNCILLLDQPSVVLVYIYMKSVD